MSQRKIVVGGPGRFDLMVALFTGKQVRLHLKPESDTRVAIITSVSIERFLVEIYKEAEDQYCHYRGFTISGYFVVPCKDGDRQTYQKFYGFYQPEGLDGYGYLDVEDQITTSYVAPTVSIDGGFRSGSGD